MIAIVGLLFIVGVGAAALVLQIARTWVLKEAATEARLRDPDTHKLTYLVPNGQDPADLMGALAHAHFPTAVDSHGGVERLMIGCGPGDRARVRQVLEHPNQAVPCRMPGHVWFDDEATGR